MIISDKVRWVILGLLAVGLCLSTHHVAAEVSQSQFYSLFGWMTAAFACLVGLIWLKPNDKQVYVLLGIGILIRWILMWYGPLLSDDIHRFLWDGQLWHSGVNPFSATPESLLNQGGLGEWYTARYPLLNSQSYFTIYPPVCQAIFWLSTIDGLPLWMWGGMTIRSIFFIAELVTIFSIVKIAKHFGKPLYNTLVYILNPLIIIELIGNLHFEAVMVCFLALMLLALVKDKPWVGGLYFGLAVCAKMVPLMFGPFLLFYLGWKRGLKFFGIAGVVVLGTFGWMLQGHISEILASINLYFQTFEFNASIYYVGRAIGQYIKGYNIIQSLGPALSLIGLIGIIAVSLRATIFKKPIAIEFNNSHIIAMMMIFTIYLLTATTVHPWYLSTLILFSAFTNLRYAIVWSWTIILSYSAYLVDPTTELLWLVGLEYVVMLGILIWEKPLAFLND